MNTQLLASASYRDGSVALTDSHLLFLRPDDTVRLAFALEHVSEVTVEFEHSFRHRTLGLLCAVVLFAVSVFFLGIFQFGDAVGLPRTTGRIGIAGLFAFLFGMLFLLGVLRSRRVHWLCFRYARVRRQFDLPDVSLAELEKLAARLPIANQ